MVVDSMGYKSVPLLASCRSILTMRRIAILLGVLDLEVKDPLQDSVNTGLNC